MTTRITLVALACLLAGSALAIYLTAREAQRHNVELADTVGRQLGLQLSRIGRSTDVPARFPDWDLVAGLSLRPGQCIEMCGVDGAIKRSSCAGVDALALTNVAMALSSAVLPLALAPLLLLMNDRRYLGRHCNGWLANGFAVLIVGLSLALAVVSIPLAVVGG